MLEMHGFKKKSCITYLKKKPEFVSEHGPPRSLNKRDLKWNVMLLQDHKMLVSELQVQNYLKKTP